MMFRISRRRSGRLGGEKGGDRGAVFSVLECRDGDALFPLFIFFPIFPRPPTIRKPGESSREAQEELIVGCGSKMILCKLLIEI